MRRHLLGMGASVQGVELGPSQAHAATIETFLISVCIMANKNILGDYLSPL